MIFSDWYKGISKSKYDQQGFDNLVNVDVHSVLGELRCQLALASESTTPNENCISEVVSNGDTFFFSTESGKIWKRTFAGTYSIVHTNTNGANKGCGLFNGVLYYATATKLGKITEALASSESSWSSQNDSFGTFTVGSSYKPMKTVGSSIFIGDGYLIAAVDSTGSFSANVLDLPSIYSATTLIGVGDDLLIGTIIGTNVQSCKLFLWDRISPAWTYADEIGEAGIACMIKGDNITYLITTSGNTYYWNGSQAIKFKKIRGVTPSVNHYASTMLNGRALFATGTKVFSIHRETTEMPWAIVQEYTLTAGTCQSIIAVGSQLLVSTGDNIDKIGTTYATATIDTPIAKGQNVTVHYDSLGTGGTIGISTTVDGADYVEQTVTPDVINKKAYFDGSLGKVNFMQARITLTPGTGTIGISSIEI